MPPPRSALPPKRPAQKRGGGGGWLILAMVVPAAVFVLPTTLLFVLGMVPTLVAYITDTDPDKTAPLTVGCINFCGVLPFAFNLWQGPHTVQGVLTVVGNPTCWLIMYGAAGVGWLLYTLIPTAIANLEVMRAETKVQSLLEKKRSLAQEWGPEVATDDGEAAAAPPAKGRAAA